MKQQGGWITIENGGWIGRDANQGIRHHQGSGRAVQTTDLLKATHAEVQWTQGDPVANIGVRNTILEKHAGPASRDTKPTQRQLHRKTPLPWRHPKLGLWEGTRQRRQRQFVLQTRSGGQHNRADGAMVGFELCDGGA